MSIPDFPWEPHRLIWFHPAIQGEAAWSLGGDAGLGLQRPGSASDLLWGILECVGFFS